jgi:molybdopterin-guanine dinucleotide biosynthesis protein A
MLSVIVQAGGKSSRMGQDKALMPFLGQPLVQRVLQRVRPLADEVLLITHRSEDYSFLNIPLLADEIPGRGALGGLYTALLRASQPLVLVAACDMPFINPDLLALQRDLLLSGSYDAVIPRTGSGIEPFHAVYRRAACLPAVEAALQADKWRMDSWLPAVNVRFLTQEEAAELGGVQEDDFLLSFWNLNTPEDFTKAESLVLPPTQ